MIACMSGVKLSGPLIICRISAFSIAGMRYSPLATKGSVKEANNIHVYHHAIYVHQHSDPSPK